MEFGFYGATAAEIVCIAIPAQVRAKHCEKFGWLPLSNVAAVTKPRREAVEIS